MPDLGRLLTGLPPSTPPTRCSGLTAHAGIRPRISPPAEYSPPSSLVDIVREILEFCKNQRATRITVRHVRDHRATSALVA